MGRNSSLSVRLAFLSGVFASTLAAVPQDPDLYLRSQEQLAAGDTLAALASLRELTREDRDFAPGWGLLGRVLTAKASGVATDFHERLEAEKALRRALELDAGNPLYTATLGELKRKQQIYIDARRMLDRALDAVEADPDALSPADRAALWFQRGLFYEDAYLDTWRLVFAPDVPVSVVNCDAPVFCLNFTDPREFNRRMEHATDLSEFAEPHYDRMIDAFQKTLEADPAHSNAFRRLAIHWVDREEYERALELTQRYVEDAPEDPWGHITLGLIHQRLGEDALAQAALDRGLGRLPPEIAAHYRDISPVLGKKAAKHYESANDLVRQKMEETLWRKSDPLYLTPENEVRVAHLARVAFADLMFEDPSTGTWGSETERGIVYVRYGPPRRIWMRHREMESELSSLEVSGALACIAAGLGCTPGMTGETSRQGGGRWIFWNYGDDLPNFVFGKQLRYRRVTHLMSSYSKTWEEQLHKYVPAQYRVRFAILPHPAQIARFRGSADTVIELDVYSEVPTASLVEEVRADSVQVGVFIFGGPEHIPVYRRALTVPARAETQAVTYSVPLLEGRYTVGIEARAAYGGAAVRRDTLEVRAFRDGALALSDLVLADAVTARTEEPSGRRDFALKVNRRLEFERGMPVALYWEVYGLTPGEDGLARYQVTLGITDVKDRDVLASVVGALRGLFGASRGEVKVTYESAVELSGDRVPDYVSLQLPPDDARDYRIQLEVTDLRTGKTATAERVFRVVER